MKIIFLTLLLTQTQPSPQYFFMHTPDGDTVIVDTSSKHNGHFRIRGVQHQGRWRADHASDMGQWQQDGNHFKAHKSQ